MEEKNKEPVAPRTWTDHDGRSWSIEITIPDVSRIKNRIGVNVLEIVDVKGDLFKRATSDVIFLCDVLFAVHEPQALKAGISDEQFGASLRGDAIENAFDALFLAVCDFFPSERRSLLTSLHGRLIRYGETARTMAGEAINQEETEDQRRKIVSTFLGLGGSAFASPDGSGSTPTPSAG